MINTILQIIIFVASILLIVLCILQSNKGQNILNGFTNSGSNLFSSQKDVGYDKVITRIISVLIALFFILSLVEGLL